MVEKVQYKVNDVVRMKKKHPCGSDTWTFCNDASCKI